MDAADPSGEFDYGPVSPTNGGIGGGIGTSPDGGSGFATFYVEVDDPAKYFAKAEKLGGSTVVLVTEPAMGLRFAYVADPEGHVFGIGNGLSRMNHDRWFDKCWLSIPR